MKEIVLTKKQIPVFVKSITETLLQKKVLCLEGELGSGKTFLAKHIIQNLLNNKNVRVVSPTFGIVNVYTIPDKNAIYHFDLYRVKNIQELEEIGFFEALENGICIIEWPQIARKFLQNAMNISIKILNEKERLLVYVCSNLIRS